MTVLTQVKVSVDSLVELDEAARENRHKITRHTDDVSDDHDEAAGQNDLTTLIGLSEEVCRLNQARTDTIQRLSLIHI